MLTASMARYIGDLLGRSLDDTRALLAGVGARIVHTGARPAMDDLARTISDLGIAACVVPGAELDDEVAARRAVLALEPHATGVKARVEGMGEFDVQGQDIERVARGHPAGAPVLVLWRFGRSGALVVDPARCDLVAFGAGRDLPVDDTLEKLSRTLAAHLPADRPVDDALKEADVAPGTGSDLMDALDVARIYEARAAGRRPLPAPSATTTNATRGAASGPIGLAAALPPEETDEPLEPTMVVASAGMSSTMRRAQPATKSLGAIGLVAAAPMPTGADPSRPSPSRPSASAPGRPSPSGSGRTAPHRPFAPSPSSPGAPSPSPSSSGPLELSRAPVPRDRAVRAISGTRARTVCTMCDAVLPDEGPYLVVNGRPWCDTCAAPHVAAATHRPSSLRALLIATGGVAAFGAVAAVISWATTGVVGGVFAVLAALVSLRLYTNRSATRAVHVDVLRFAGGRTTPLSIT